MRSSSKPIQALPLARARADLDDRDLAIASASHRATDDQIADRRSLLAKAPATEGRPRARPPGGPAAQKIFNNCSGKHAGMLRALPCERLADRRVPPARHPVQRRAQTPTSKPSKRRRRAADPASTACGVVTFGLPLERIAYALLALRTVPQGGRIADAMPRSLTRRRPDGVDCQLMRAAAGGFAKGGAEGLLCAAPERPRHRPQVGRRRRPSARPGPRRLLGPFGVALPDLVASR